MTIAISKLTGRSGDARALDRAGFPHVGECLGAGALRRRSGMQQHQTHAATASATGDATTG